MYFGYLSLSVTCVTFFFVLSGVCVCVFYREWFFNVSSKWLKTILVSRALKIPLVLSAYHLYSY